MCIAWPADYGNNVIVKGFFKCRHRERFFSLSSLPFLCCSKNICCYIFFFRKAKTVCCVNALFVFLCMSCFNLPKSSVFISIHKFSGPEYILMWQNEETHAPFVNIKCRHGFLASLFPVSHLTAVGRHQILWQENKSLNNMQPDKSNCHIHVFFFSSCGCFVCLDSRWYQASFEITAEPIHDKMTKNDLITHGKHCRMIGGNVHKTEAAAKRTVTLNDTGILF